MYINREDIPKLSSSLLINVNENQFRGFFTDDKMTRFLCKSVIHTTTNCKKNTENKLISDHLLDSNVISSFDATTEVLTEDTVSTTLPNLESLDQTNMRHIKNHSPNYHPQNPHPCQTIQTPPRQFQIRK